MTQLKKRNPVKVKRYVNIKRLNGSLNSSSNNSNDNVSSMGRRGGHSLGLGGGGGSVNGNGLGHIENGNGLLDQRPGPSSGGGRRYFCNSSSDVDVRPDSTTPTKGGGGGRFAVSPSSVEMSPSPPPVIRNVLEDEGEEEMEMDLGEGEGEVEESILIENENELLADTPPEQAEDVVVPGSSNGYGIRGIGIRRTSIRNGGNVWPRHMHSRLVMDLGDEESNGHHHHHDNYDYDVHTDDDDDDLRLRRNGIGKIISAAKRTKIISSTVSTSTGEVSSTSTGLEEECWEDDVDVEKCHNRYPMINQSSSAAIPLPAPPSLTPIGGAYGGNQSYLRHTDGPISSAGFSSLAGPSANNSSLMGIGGAGGGGPPKIPGVVGFGNLGNTCFMNSGLQALLNTPPLIDFFLSTRPIEDVGIHKMALAQAYQGLVLNAWEGPQRVIQPREFKETLGSIFPCFKDTRQHDCQEFLNFIFEQLNDNLKIWNGAKKAITSESSSGFASGGGGEAEAASAHDSDVDVTSSVQSPAAPPENNDADGSSSTPTTPPNNNNVNSTTTTPETVTKRRRLTTEEETAAATEKDSKDDNDDENEKPSPASANEEGNHMEVDAGSDITGNGGIGNGNSPEEQDQGTNSGANSASDDVDQEEEEDLDDERRKALVLKERAREAESFWMNFIRDNNTVITSSFQGMFKCTTTCSVCNYASCNFEPFMFLPLPIPRAREKEFDVFIHSAMGGETATVTVSLDVDLTVRHLKEAVIKELYKESGPSESNFVVAEVVNYNIFTILKDEQHLKYVRDGLFNIYLIELNTNFPVLEGEMGGGFLTNYDSNMFVNQSTLNPTTYLEEDWETDTVGTTQATVTNVNDSYTSTVVDVGGEISEDNATQTQTDVDVDTDKAKEALEQEDFSSCIVCLDDLPKSKLKQHWGCSCVLCSECIAGTAKAHQSNQTDQNSTVTTETPTHLKCPVCSEVVDHSKCFVTLASSSSDSPKLCMVPIVFNNCPDKDSNNNNSFQSSQPIGHPFVVQVPSSIPAQEFYSFIAQIVPFPTENYRVINAAWEGKGCGVCVYNHSCSGCEFRKEGTININSRNSILISFSDLKSELITSIEPSLNMATYNGQTYSLWGPHLFKEDRTVDIAECLEAFSQVESLSEENAWMCSRCNMKQCATRQVTICRFPDYLIVHLKRFVFIDNTSSKMNNKCHFPMQDFDVSKYIAEEFAGGEHIYDLYSCVCHYGSTGGGHYTSYTKNPRTGQWHFFNDDTVTPKLPSDDEYASGYLLFYAKKGLPTR